MAEKQRAEYVRHPREKDEQTELKALCLTLHPPNDQETRLLCHCPLTAESKLELALNISQHKREMFHHSSEKRIPTRSNTTVWETRTHLFVRKQAEITVTYRSVSHGNANFGMLFNVSCNETLDIWVFLFRTYQYGVLSWHPQSNDRGIFSFLFGYTWH